MGFRPGYVSNQYQCQHLKKNLPSFLFFYIIYLFIYIYLFILSGVTCLLPVCMMKHKHIALDNLEKHISGIIGDTCFRIWTCNRSSLKLRYIEHIDTFLRFGILLRFDSCYNPHDAVLQGYLASERIFGFFFYTAPFQWIGVRELL